MGILSAWWKIVTSIGPARRAGRQGDLLFRFYLIKALDDIGVFEFLADSRAYGEILADFGLTDSEYTREVLETPGERPRRMLRPLTERYVHPQVHFPSLDEVLRKVDPRHSGPSPRWPEG